MKQEECFAFLCFVFFVQLLNSRLCQQEQRLTDSLSRLYGRPISLQVETIYTQEQYDVVLI